MTPRKKRRRIAPPAQPPCIRIRCPDPKTYEREQMMADMMSELVVPDLKTQH